MNTEYTLPYLLCGLEATPDVLDRLLDGVTDPALYDRRPDPDRFTLREVLAHLAEWDEIFRERLARTAANREAADPGLSIPDIDEGRLAVEHDYAHADPVVERRLFRTRRQALVTLLHGLPADRWERAATHTSYGPLTVLDQVLHVLGHDGYHLRQIVQQLSAGGGPA